MTSDEKTTWLWCFIAAIIIYFLITVTQGCTVTPPVPTPTLTPTPVVTLKPTPTVSPTPTPTVPFLSWEKTIEAHPEREAWSKILWEEINANFVALNTVKDMQIFCPSYAKLTNDKKIQAWAELFVWLSYYESAFDPTEASQDVGTFDKRTWSTGLWQVSACDVENYNLTKIMPKYTFEDLKTVAPNAKLAVALMARQVFKNGLIVQSNFSNVYWATLYHGRYDEIDGIATHVQRLAFCK